MPEFIVNAIILDSCGSSSPASDYRLATVIADECDVKNIIASTAVDKHHGAMNFLIIIKNIFTKSL